MLIKRCLLPAALVANLFAGDPYCPRYPDSVRAEHVDLLELDRSYAAFSRMARFGAIAGREQTTRSNVVDQHLFAKMAADNVRPAAASSDAEFVRRIHLDLTGRIPTPEVLEAFLADRTPDKRAKLIDQLLATSAFTDQLTTYWANKYKITRSHENIGTRGRNTFYEWLRNSMAADRPYDALVRELLSASGEVDSVPGTQFYARWMDLAGPAQDLSLIHI
jgi:hypothetical protein